MESSTFVSAFSGGALIGAAAVMLLLLNGRIAGVSGITGGLLTAPAGERTWRLLFILGLIAGPLLFQLLQPAWSAPQAHGSLGLYVVAGLLVGVGTRLGSGCTSGHGVCGIARLSWRSIVATLTFMATAFVTVTITRHAFGW